MSSASAVTQRGASLLDADPALGRLLGARAAEGFGHRRLLPVLALPAGGWSAPPPAALGVGTLALVVLTGALLRQPAEEPGRLLGPGDMAEPWSEPPARWTACTAVRAAVIGQAFLQAVAPWPEAAAHMLRRTRDDPGDAGLALHAAGGARAEDLLAALMWRLAARWGETDGDGVGLPLQLAPETLAGLAAVPGPEAAAGLRSLERERMATRRPDGTWLLRASARRRDGDAGRRDDLRERVTAALASARASAALCAELLEQAAAQVRLREDRRR